MNAAEAVAREKGYRVVIAVVDPAGNLMNLRRLPDTQVASSNVARDKARTAATFVRPSRVLEDQVSSGRLGALALHGAAPLTGGIPLTVDGEVVGAIGTSGETPDEDEAVSIAGSKADFSVDEVPALTYEGAQIVANAGGLGRGSRIVGISAWVFPQFPSYTAKPSRSLSQRIRLWWILTKPSRRCCSNEDKRPRSAAC